MPPYLYAAFTICDGTNEAARRRISAIVGEEMVHMALACNVLNAIGGTPVVAQASVVPIYPGPLSYDIGTDGSDLFRVSLLPFSPEAMAQAIHIEEPEDPLVLPEAGLARGLEPRYQTIGQFYDALDQALGRLPADTWSATPRNQLDDHPFFAGELFAVTSYQSASLAIRRIESEEEGNTKSPLDFEGEVAHYYRSEEIRRDQVLPPLQVQTDHDGEARVPINAGKAGSWTWVLVPWQGQAPTPPTGLDPAVSEYVGCEPRRRTPTSPPSSRPGRTSTAMSCGTGRPWRRAWTTGCCSATSSSAGPTPGWCAA